MEKLSPAIAERNIKRLCTLYNYQSVEKTFGYFCPKILKVKNVFAYIQETKNWQRSVIIYMYIVLQEEFCNYFFFSEELCFKKSFLISHRMGKFSFKLN